jgi:formylglycine-generating enzyme required for sulfatase activity
VTASGVADLNGGVAEWTASAFEPGSPQRVIRGGHWKQRGANVSCGAREYFLPGQGGASYIGFRCCL